MSALAQQAPGPHTAAVPYTTPPNFVDEVLSCVNAGHLCHLRPSLDTANYVPYDEDGDDNDDLPEDLQFDSDSSEEGSDAFHPVGDDDPLVPSEPEY